MDRWLAASLALAALAGLFSLQYHTFAADEYLYMNLAEDLGRDFTAYLDSEHVARAPLLPFLSALAYLVTGPSELATKLVNVLASLASVWLAFEVARRHFGLGAARWAALFLATNPFAVFFAGRALTESVFMLLSLGCAYAALESKRDERWLAVLGLAAGLLFLARYQGLLYLPAFAFVAWLGLRERVLRSPWTYVGAGYALVAYAPYGWVSLVTRGDPFALPLEFIGQVAAIPLEAHPLGVPDRIPSYLLAFPLALGAVLLPLALALLMGARKEWPKRLRAFLARREVLAFALPTLLLLVGLEFGILLKSLRYAAVLVPLLVVPLAAAALPRLEKDRRLRWLALACVAGNLLFGLGTAHFFGAVYEKQVAHREAGRFLERECASAYSNAAWLTRHYIKREETRDNPACVLYTLYEYRHPEVERLAADPRYSLAFEQGRVRVWKSVNA
jgi:4-amino-4-deoxy-L-arabinose transferase-like glycosyltransferase